MMCHSNHDDSGKSGHRKVSKLMLIGLALAIALVIGVLVIYGVSWQVLAIVAMIAAHPLMHMTGMHGKHSQKGEDQQPVESGTGEKGSAPHH